MTNKEIIELQVLLLKLIKWCNSKDDCHKCHYWDYDKGCILDVPCETIDADRLQEVHEEDLRELKKSQK